MAAELVETSRLCARTVREDRAGVGRAARRHLVKRTYSEPHWEARRGSVVAYREGDAVRRADRRRPHGALRPDRPGAVPRAVHPARARRGRLAAPITASSRRTGRCSTTSRSWSTGPAAATSSSTTRRCSTSTTPGSRADVVSGAHFDSWWKQGPARRPRPADLHAASCCSPRARPGSSADDYPDTWRQGGLALRLRYPFEPGTATDGVDRRDPARRAQPGRRRGLRLAGARAPARAGHRADPLAAQAAAPVARAGAGPGPRGPARGCGRTGSRCSRRSRTSSAGLPGRRCRSTPSTWPGCRRTCS